MTNDSLLRGQALRAIVLSGAVLIGATAIASSAWSEGEAAPRIAQAGEAAEAVPAKPRPRRPAPKAPAEAASKATRPPTTVPPPPTVAPAAAEASAPAAAPAAAGQPSPATPTEPVRHARDAKLGRCLDRVTRASTSTIDTAHAAVSTWSQQGPDDHMFQSIVALSYSNVVAPKAAAVLVAAPEGAGCEATTVQVYPTARSCGDVEGDLRKAGRTIGEFGGVAMTQEPGNARHLLLPAPGTGCVVVAVGLALNP